MVLDMVSPLQVITQSYRTWWSCGDEIGDGNIGYRLSVDRKVNGSGFHRNTNLGYQTMANVGSNSAQDNTTIGYRRSRL